LDHKTLCIYDRKAADFAADWEDGQAPPVDLRDAVRLYFGDGPTVDVGCGSGRDAAWLSENGFDVVGLDASTGLICEARRRHPDVRFEIDRLPELSTLQRGSYINVLCETVIMHLPVSSIAESVRQLVSLLVPGGTLYLTWRVTRDDDVRDDEGRLYSSFSPSLVRDALAPTQIVLDEERVSASSGKVIYRIVAVKRTESSF
jgi:SAM-dependent methyltransferase